LVVRDTFYIYHGLRKVKFVPLQLIEFSWAIAYDYFRSRRSIIATCPTLYHAKRKPTFPADVRSTSPLAMTRRTILDFKLVQHPPPASSNRENRRFGTGYATPITTPQTDLGGQPGSDLYISVSVSIVRTLSEQTIIENS
jgi:hypothetical protein